MLNKKLFQIKNSPIHGKGVFATQNIPAEALIGTYEGEETYENDTYVLWITDENDHEYGIDGSNDLRYLNHSNKANACFYGNDIYAEQNINKGDEITFHYGKEFEKHIQELNSQKNT